MAFRYDASAFENVPNSENRLLMNKCEWLWTNRQKLSHASLRYDLNHLFKWAVGNYRIIYTFDKESDNMVIRLVAHRRDVYRRAAGLDD